MCGLSAELKRKQIKSATGLLPAINKTILSESVYFLGIKTQKKHKYPFTTPSCTTYFKYCEAVHHDVLIAGVGEEEEAVAPRSVLLSKIIQQLFCRKKEVGMRCMMKLLAESKMKVTIQETMATMSPATRGRGKCKLKTNLKLI